MVSFPTEPSDLFDFAGSVVRGTSNRGSSGFGAPVLPAQNGNSTRQAQIPNERAGIYNRNMMRWFVPETGIVEMFINPQNITYQLKKDLSEQRTKGGYVVQYWGEALTNLSIRGTTGSSGIEGINVLEDIYRAEQIAYDPYALALASQRDREVNDQFSVFGSSDLGGLLNDAGNTFTNLVGNAIETGSSALTRQQPTLASLAFSVELYWSGWVFRGFFTDFTVEESAEKIGLFDYTMNFRVTQRRGLRLNFFPWHRSAVNGPSDSDPSFGVPYSYVDEGRNGPVVSPPSQENDGISLRDAFDTGIDFIKDPFGAGSVISSIF